MSATVLVDRRAGRKRPPSAPTRKAAIDTDELSRAESLREDERRTIAHMLHDDLGQIVTNMRLELAAAIRIQQSLAQPGGHDIVDRLQSIAGLLDLGAETLRRITTALRPQVLIQLGLAASVSWEAGLFERRTGIRCQVRVAPGLTVDDDAATTLYRILLEALNNVVKHASAGSVRITVVKSAGALVMTVRDNGRGVTDAQRVNPATIGLQGMRERALAAGGDLRISSPNGSGTRLVVTIPDRRPAGTRGRAKKVRPRA